MVKLGQVAQYFRTGPQAVNAQTGVLVQLLASLLEPRMACAGSVISVCINGVVRQYRRSDAEVNDAIIEFVAVTCAKFFGHRTNWGDVDVEPIFEMTPPSGARAWQRSRAVELCSDLNTFGVQPAFDVNVVDSVTTADGWTYLFSSRSWQRNRLADGRLRVVGKTRDDLSTVSGEHQTLVWSLWDAVHAFEASGGRSIATEESPEQQVVMDALAALLQCEGCEWFRALLQTCNNDVDVAIYLVKQACRCIAGLKYVEVLLLYGCKRSGKDTFVG